MNKKEFFQFSFIVLFCFLCLTIILGFTVKFLGNPLNLSFHQDFFIGSLFGITLISCAYMGWVKYE